MSDPLAERAEVGSALQVAAAAARAYLERLDEEPALPPGAEHAIRGWSDPMPERGDGSLKGAERVDREGNRVGDTVQRPPVLSLAFIAISGGVMSQIAWPFV